MKKYVLVHLYMDSGFNSIICFSDSLTQLEYVRSSHPRFGSSRHLFVICPNNNMKRVGNVFLSRCKDDCLINICKNVSEYLSVAEYAMLKKSYFKSSAWFEKAKQSCSIASDIIDNY